MSWARVEAEHNLTDDDYHTLVPDDKGKDTITFFQLWKGCRAYVLDQLNKPLEGGDHGHLNVSE